MRPEPLVRDMDEDVPASFHAYDEKIRDLFEQQCRDVIESASKSLVEHRKSLETSLASPVKVWNFRAWMERRFDDDLDRCWISYEDARIRKAMLALSEKELSKS